MQIPEQNAPLLALLGEGIDSIRPRPPLELPGVPAWMLFKLGVDVVQDRIVRDTSFEWWIYGDPGQAYHDIDAVEAQLVSLYPANMPGFYQDAAGVGWYQEYAGSSGDTEDDQWKHTLRICRWLLRRA
jgi:hypothetical protein